MYHIARAIKQAAASTAPLVTREAVTGCLSHSTEPRQSVSRSYPELNICCNIGYDTDRNTGYMIQIVTQAMTQIVTQAMIQTVTQAMIQTVTQAMIQTATQAII